VELQIDAVLQPERLELLLVDVAGQPPLHLVAELRDPLADKGVDRIRRSDTWEPQAAFSRTG
jgi:hypothetical protein